MRAALPLSYFYRPKPLPPQGQSAPVAMPQQKDPVSQILDGIKGSLGEQGISNLFGSGGTSTAGTSMAELGGTGATNGISAGAEMGATPIAIPAVAAISAVLAGKAGLDMLKGKTPKGPAGQFGRGTLAVASGGLSEAGNKIKKFAGFGRGNSKLEDQKRAKLAERGINLTGENGWESNPDFKRTRDEKFLKGSEIVGGAGFFDIPGWENASDEARLQVAEEAQKRNAFREHNGGGDVDFSDPEFQKFISQRIRDPKLDQKSMDPGFLINRVPGSSPTPMPRGGGIRDAMYIAGRDGPVGDPGFGSSQSFKDLLEKGFIKRAPQGK